jgi:hypothetical protein
MAFSRGKKSVLSVPSVVGKIGGPMTRESLRCLCAIIETRSFRASAERLDGLHFEASRLFS